MSEKGFWYVEAVALMLAISGALFGIHVFLQGL